VRARAQPLYVRLRRCWLYGVELLRAESLLLFWHRLHCRGVICTKVLSSLSLHHVQQSRRPEEFACLSLDLDLQSPNMVAPKTPRNNQGLLPAACDITDCFRKLTTVEVLRRPPCVRVWRPPPLIGSAGAASSVFAGTMLRR
jgi:hypothetical protein